MSQPGDERLQLTDGDAGVFLVSTGSGSNYQFDLETRVGDELRRQAAPTDSLQPLRGIIGVRVGRPGRWWMRNLSGGYVVPAEVWQYSSAVVSIERQGATGAAAESCTTP